jgi:hypothetical protein
VSAPIRIDLRCLECDYDGPAPLKYDPDRGAWYATCPACVEEYLVEPPKTTSTEDKPC